MTSRRARRALISLRSSSLRFYEPRESVQGISDKMLSQDPAGARDGLVRPEVEPTTPPQVTYGLVSTAPARQRCGPDRHSGRAHTAVQWSE
ncbi:winged helix-turn-helix transcriptional regulator [Streptomyces sp. NPDC058377]|uniref:winged helix-turn-helix transcriptional regulator n=1 Tax=Streptomyces sp. NPDC058377 TaxID=3346468 RepID=UPI0036540C42